MNDDNKPQPFAHQETPAPRRSPMPDHPPEIDDEPITSPGVPAMPKATATHGYVRGVVGQAEDALKRVGGWALLILMGMAVMAGFGVKAALAADLERMVVDKNKTNGERFDLIERRIGGLEKMQDGFDRKQDGFDRKLDVVIDRLPKDGHK